MPNNKKMIRVMMMMTVMIRVNKVKNKIVNTPVNNKNKAVNNSNCKLYQVKTMKSTNKLHNSKIL